MESSSFFPVRANGTPNLTNSCSVKCGDKTVKESYHVICKNCAHASGCCEKCLTLLPSESQGTSTGASASASDSPSEAILSPDCGQNQSQLSEPESDSSADPQDCSDSGSSLSTDPQDYSDSECEN